MADLDYSVYEEIGAAEGNPEAFLAATSSYQGTKVWFDGLPYSQFVYSDSSDLKHWFDGLIMSGLDYVTPAQWLPVEIPQMPHGHFKALAVGREKPDPGAGAGRRSRFLMNAPITNEIIAGDVSFFDMFDFVDVPVTTLYTTTLEVTFASRFAGPG